MKRSLGRYRKLYAGGVFEGRRVNSVTMMAEAWLWRLLLLADDCGNLPADRTLLRRRGAPLRDLTPQQVDTMTDALVGAGLLEPYEADGEKYLHIPDFVTFQSTPNGKRTCRYPHRPSGAANGVCANPNESKRIQIDPDNPDESSSPKALVLSPKAEGRRPASEWQARGPLDEPSIDPMEIFGIVGEWSHIPPQARTFVREALAELLDRVADLGHDPGDWLRRAIAVGRAECDGAKLSQRVNFLAAVLRLAVINGEPPGVADGGLAAQIRAELEGKA